MKKVTTIDLIRHGEPVGGKKYRGQSDDPLSEKGWTQMRDAVAGHKPWQVIVSSTLSRCADFAKELSTQLNIPLQLDARLMEIAFGEWEGKTAAEIDAEVPGWVDRFLMDPIANKPQGAETLHDFKQRVVAGWNDVVKNNVGQHVLLVGHAGMMRAIMAEVLDMALPSMYRIDVPNAGITRIRIEYRDAKPFARLVFHAGKL